MIEKPEKEYGPKEVSPEKGWLSFMIRVRQEVVEKANELIKAKPEEEALILAEVDMLDEILVEIGKAGPERRRQLIESSWQEKKIPEDIYQKLAGRMEAESGFEKLAKEAGLDQGVTKEKITGPEAVRAAADAVEEVIQKNPFWKNLREKISGAGVKSKEIYQAVSKTLQEKKVFGVSLTDHLKNMGTGAAVRTTTRWGLGFLTGGAGYLLASGAGAVSGGILEGRKVYKKEKNIVGLSEEEFAQKLEEIKEKAGQDLKKRIDIYSEIAKNQEESSWSEEKKKLRDELEKSLVRRAVIRGIGKGALVGALGGAVGSALSDVVGHFFAPEKAVKGAAIIKGAKDSAAQATKERAEDAAGETYEKAIREGLDSLRNNDFSVKALKGEGQTQVARRIIRDFIAQDRALGSDLKLNEAQLIYAEDILQKNFARGPVKLGHEFSIKGEKIMEAIRQAQNLSAEKLQNIQERFVPKISEETWGKITDYDSLGNTEAVEAIKAEAEKKAGEAAGKVLQEAAQAGAEARNITPEIAEAKNVWFKAKWMEYGLGAALVGAAAVATALGYKLGRKSGGDAGSVKLGKDVDLKTPKSVVAESPTSSTSEGTDHTAGSSPEKLTFAGNRVLRLNLEKESGNVIARIVHSLAVAPEQELEGLRKLEQLFKDKTWTKKLEGLTLKIADKNKEVYTNILGHRIVQFNYNTPLDELRRYLEEAAEKAGKL